MRIQCSSVRSALITAKPTTTLTLMSRVQIGASITFDKMQSKQLIYLFSSD